MTRRLVWGVAAAAALLTARPASAQSLRPNILIVFDTSGSMQLDETSTWAGERINEQAMSCPAAPAGKFSRLYALKTALREALAQTGTDEANFGLMSFPQLSDPMLARTDAPRGAMNFGCATCTSPACGAGPVGHYYVDPSVGNGCRLSGDPLTTLNTTAAETPYGAWFDQSISQALRVDLTKATPGTKPVASDFDPADANLPRIYRYIDDSEDPGPVAAISDPELHANGGTPLGRSLYYARLYFDNFIKTAADPKKTCRQNVVILVTDGNEECDTDPGAINFQTCALSTGPTFYPVAQACKLFRNSGVKTYVITDASVTGSVNNTIAFAGGTTSAIKVSLTDTASVKAALIGIIAETVPPAELCNGKDDNCNGLIDEGVKNMCPLDLVNLTHCAVEACNCKDDNCNGQIDEGLPPNACGDGCGCAVPNEICDGLDNNCDGRIDEGFLVGQSCTNGQLGACRRGGLLQCKPDGSGTFCDAPTVTPGVETCNNMDDDCDGVIDNGNLPGTGLPCGNNLGICQSGTTVCRNGHLECDTVTTPQPELCNGKDDNCDGIVDNGVFPQVGTPCLCPGLTQAQVDVKGDCKAGHLVCAGAQGFVCVGCVLPRPEVCDGKDNDCDGVGDNMAVCDAGRICRAGMCEIPCGSGEFSCPAGYQCIADICVPQRCLRKTCPADMKCDNDTGDCIGLCEKVTCPSPQHCKAGQCVDCNSPGESCPTGQRCIGGACKVDLCLGVKCDEGTYCDQGACVDLCSRVTCDNATQRCVAGQCVSDACSQVTCDKGQYCDMASGQCQPNRCAAIQCGPGERCVPTLGECKADPCLNITCPAPCWSCDTTPTGVGTCVIDFQNPVCSVQRITAGTKGGGCACAVDEESGPGGNRGTAIFVAFMLAIASARRGRRSPRPRR
ncbi:MAG TPA: MopE-related protein [Polyangia bacterium]|nr:MopE-related protein [Polyangia bacterium]